MKTITLIAMGLALLFVAVIAPAHAYPPDLWWVALGNSETGGLAFGLGSLGESELYEDAAVYPSAVGVFVQEYMHNGPDFPRDSGLYSSAYRTPIPSGENKTWWDIYMWAQNYAPVTPYRIPFRTGTGDYDMRPTGYAGLLVLDYVPAECAWTGPTEFWLDLAQINIFTLPIITTSDPLQGVRMHLTVYAPEPSSLLALFAGMAGMAGLAVKRRRG